VDRKIDRNRSAVRQRIVLEHNEETKDLLGRSKLRLFLTRSLASYQNLSSDEKTAISKAGPRTVVARPDPDVPAHAIGFGFLDITGESNFSLLMEPAGKLLEIHRTGIAAADTSRNRPSLWPANASVFAEKWPFKQSDPAAFPDWPASNKRRPFVTLP